MFTLYIYKTKKSCPKIVNPLSLVVVRKLPILQYKLRNVFKACSLEIIYYIGQMPTLRGIQLPEFKVPLLHVRTFSRCISSDKSWVSLRMLFLRSSNYAWFVLVHAFLHRRLQVEDTMPKRCSSHWHCHRVFRTSSSNVCTVCDFSEWRY